MYRKPSGDLGFSFTRFANNAGASFMFDSVKDPGHISAVQRDMVFNHQFSLAPPQDPLAFVPEIFAISGILDNESISRKAFKKLQKADVLTPEGRVDTRQIGPTFTHQLAIITVIRQKQIVDMLFWWEEECSRMSRLREAREAFQADLEQAKMVGDEEGVATATAMIQKMDKMMSEKPSARTNESGGEGVAGIRTGAGGEALPQYTAA